MLDLLGHTRGELNRQLAAWGFPQVHAARLWRYVYREGVVDVTAMRELPARLRTQLAEGASIGRVSVERHQHSGDGLTQKFLLRLGDGAKVETVRMDYRDRVTACVSSQVGCALGCVFCATGQMGFTRNLSAGEIVAQVLHVQRQLREVRRGEQRSRVGNVVLMGMGEPLQNYAAVMQAAEILNDSAGLAIGAKQITVSTVGVVPGIVRLADEGRPYSLAVSLHAASQQRRAEMLPVAHAWPLDELIDACRYYTGKSGKKVFLEWTLIAGTNDSPEEARELAHLVGALPAQVNLIPLNPTEGFAASPGTIESARRFQAVLRDLGLPCTIRQRRGIDIAGGCGQLAGREFAEIAALNR